MIQNTIYNGACNMDPCNGKKIIADKDGVLYICFRAIINNFPQIMVYKSIDKGITWINTEFPQIPGYNQTNPSMVIDSNDKVHIVWSGFDSINTGTPQIKYSNNASGSWSDWTNIQVGAYDRLYPSIAIDSNDKLHIVCHGQDSSTKNTNQIKYSNNVSGSWSDWINISIVDGYAQYSASMAIDSNDKCHVIWYGNDSSNSYSQIKYSNNASGNWSNWINIQIISGNYQYCPTIAIDSNDKCHIIWYGRDSSNATYSQIKYSNNVSGSWSEYDNIQTISGYNQYSPSIVIDSNDKIHVAWCGLDSINTLKTRIMYSNNIAGSWSDYEYKDKIIGSDNGNINPALLYYNNSIHILYTFDGGISIKFLSFCESNIYNGTCNIGGTGTRKIAVTSDGQIYTCFAATISSKQQILVYKSINNGVTWVDTGFPKISGYTQINPSIAIDSNDKVHIVWNGLDSASTTYQIKYSNNVSGSWSSWINIQLISDGQYSPSIAIDSNDKIHVAWYGFSASNINYAQIKYSSNVSGSWSNWINIQNISGNSMQVNPSIAIDSNNKVHIIWSGLDNTNTASYQIKYSNNVSGSWSNWINIQLINGYSQSNPSIAIDSNDKIHVTWHGCDNYYTTYSQIKYSNNVSGSWSKWINIQEISSVQSNPSIAITSDDKCHIAWCGLDSSILTRQIKYSNNASGSWNDWTDKSCAYNIECQSPSIIKTSNYMGILYLGGSNKIKIINEIKIVLVIPNILIANPKHVYNNENSSLYIDTTDLKGGSQVQYKININGVDLSGYGSLQSATFIEASIPYNDLSDGNNEIKIYAKNDLGIEGFATLIITKEELYRASVERTFLSFDGGYKQQNVLVDGKANLKQIYEPVTLQESSNRHNIRLDGYITGISKK